MTNTTQASVHNFAFLFWDKRPEKNITDENISKTLFWLLDAINSGKLEAWHNAKEINKVQGFTANETNAGEIFVNFLAFRNFLNKRIDVAFEKKSLERHKKIWTNPVRGLDPTKDLILLFQILPKKIKNDLLNHETAHKRQKELPGDIKELIHDICKSEDLELIYDSIKDGTGFSGKTPNAHEQRKEDAIFYYSEYKNDFKYLTKEDLEDCSEAFHITSEQAPRTVKGKLLRQILKRTYLRSRINYQTAFEYYQKCKQKK